MCFARYLTHQKQLKRIDRRSGTFPKDRKKLLSFENEVHNLKRLSHHHLVKLLG